MDLVLPTKVLLTRVSQEIRVILPPLGKTVRYDLVERDRHAGLRGAEPESVGFAQTRFIPDPHARIAACFREVQILAPTSPKVYFDLDHPPEYYGVNRSYKLAIAPASTTIKFRLRHDQFLVAAAEEGFADLSLIVEHHKIS